MFGFRLFEKNISNFTVAKNTIAFNQTVCCNPCSRLDFNDQVIAIINDNENGSVVKAKASFYQKFNQDINNISIAPDGKNFAVLSSDANHRNIFLLSAKDATDNKELNKIYTYINSSKSNVYTAKYNNEGDLYVVDIINDTKKLILGKLSTNSNSHNGIGWKTLTSLPSNPITNVAFSNNGEYLFILLNTKKLQILAEKSNWQQIKEIENVTSLPIDVDSSGEHLVFITNKTLRLKSINSNTSWHVNFKNSISTTCFIPKTKNVLVFDNSGKIFTIKHINNSWKIDKKNIIPSEGISVVKVAYFDPNDQNKLVVIVSGNGANMAFLEKLINQILIKLGIIVGCTLLGVELGCFTACIKSCIDFDCYHDPQCLDKCFFDVCCGSGTCADDVSLGAMIGASAGGFAYFLFCLNALVNVNTVPTKLEKFELTEPKSNNIGRS